MSRSATRSWLRPVRGNEPNSDARQEEALSDRELIDAVAQGNGRVAGEIHDRLIRVVDHTLYRVLGRREHDHDDLIQTSFEQILRTLSDNTFAGKCSLRTWAGRITTHVALNALRSKCRERKVIDRGENTAERSLSCRHEGGAEARVELDRVRRILSTIRPSRVEVFILHDVHGYSLSEIASMLDISVSAAQSQLVRGRSFLHTRLNTEPKNLWKPKGCVS